MAGAAGGALVPHNHMNSGSIITSSRGNLGLQTTTAASAARAANSDASDVAWVGLEVGWCFGMSAQHVGQVRGKRGF